MISHTIKIHDENSVFSPSVVLYLIISTILTFIVWWSTTYAHSNDKIEDSELIIATVISYLLFGLVIVMMASHSDNHMISWFIITGILIPIIFVAFWLIYHNSTPKPEEIN